MNTILKRYILYNKTIGKERGNSYLRNEEISWWMAHINTRKLNWNIPTTTDVFLVQKKMYSLLVKKDICNCRNVSIKFLCVYASFIQEISFFWHVSSFFSYVVLSVLWYFPFHVVYILKYTYIMQQISRYNLSEKSYRRDQKTNQDHFWSYFVKTLLSYLKIMSKSSHNIAKINFS